MPVCRHRDEIALLALGASRDLLGGISAGENRFRLVTVLLELVGERLDVLAVAFHFLRLAEVELVDVPRGPAVGNVDQHDRRIVARASQLPDVAQDHFVVR